jgi:heme a synthase
MTQAALPPTPDVRRFKWLAFTTSLCTYLLIVVGGVVRVTGSGLACSDDWPQCNGALFPPLAPPIIIPLLHRFVTVLAALLILGAAYVAWRDYRRVRWIVWPVLWAMALLVVQILLGAATVKLALNPVVVAVHFANAFALLALLITATVVAFQLEKDPRVGDSLLHFDALSSLAGATMLGVYVLLITGAIVVGSRASTACADWPLCDGSFVPATLLGLLNIGHRYMAGGVGIMMAGAVVQAWRLRRGDRAVLVAATTTGALFAGEVMVGRIDVLRGLPVVVNGVHSAVAAAVWASSVVFAALAMQYVRLSPLKFLVPVRSKLRVATVLGDAFALARLVLTARSQALRIAACRHYRILLRRV